MRRERHRTEGSYIDWLKSLGCVFYVAFNGETGTTDLINNVPLTLTGNGSCQYDPNEDAYMFTQPSFDYTSIGIWNNGINSQTFPNGDMTVLGRVKRITTTNGKYAHTLGPNIVNNRNILGSLGVGWAGTHNVGAWTSNSFNCAETRDCSQDQRIVYQNGVFAHTASYPSSINPSTAWGNISGIIIGPAERSVDYDTQFYCYNAYLFNTVLDLATIRKIQGYE